MVVVNEFVVCAVVVGPIIAWSVLSKFTNFSNLSSTICSHFSSNQRGQVPRRERDTRLDIEYVTYVQCPKKCNNGRVRCTTCSAQGMVTCKTCKGSGQLVHYLELTRTFTDNRLKIIYELYKI